MKLRAHLILLALATVAPALLFAVGLIVYHTQLERSSLERGMRDTARALALALDRDVNDIKNGVETLAGSRYLDGQVDLTHFYEEASTISKGFGGWAVLSDPAGRQVLNTSRPLGTALPIPTPDSLEMMRSVADGRKTFVSNVFTGTVSRQAAVIVATPVIRNDKVRFILDFPFPPTQFTNLLKEAQLSRGWIAVVTDRDGGVVARVPDAEVFVGKKEGPAWTAGTAGADEGFIQGEVLRGPAVYAAYKRSKETGWTVGVAAPIKLVDAGIRRSMLALSSGGFVLLALGCGLAFVLGKRIVEPIVALADWLKAEPSTPLPPAESRVTEVEDLRRALEDARTAAQRAELAHAARREAEAANRAKDDFLAVLSHELRTPLNATFGWVRMLRSGQLDAGAAAHALEVIERNVNQQARLISDLLDASRIVFGRLELNFQSVDLPALVGGVVDSVRPTAEIKGIALKAELDPEAGPVRGDPDRLRQVVENIVGNAIKFTPQGGAITVQLARDADATLIVSDTGRGIDAELLPHIFERFKQSDSTSTRAHAGLGLGLAIVRHLVELQGGRVRAESAGPGHGSTFTVVLPIAAAAPGAAALGQSSANAEGGQRLDGVRVMVLEDDDDTRDLVASILTRAGAVAFASGSARDGAAMAARVRPDVLVCDLAMPDKDGLDLVREIKSWAAEAGVHLPALALSAYARTEDRDRALAAGFDIYVSKPVDPSELVRAVVRLVRR
ncbi:MAG TPA: ATP-binding protein [Methylomirabilota bacterium]|nr:ATP-binding protein [Methylomirabilota bacterium]